MDYLPIAWPVGKILNTFTMPNPLFIRITKTEKGSVKRLLSSVSYCDYAIL